MKKNVKRVLVISTIIIFLIFITIEGYNYYESRYIPKHFVSSFLEDLEKNGPVVTSYGSYFVGDYFINGPLVKKWNDYYLEDQKKDSLSIQKKYSFKIEQLFEIWKKTYVAGIEDYLVSTPTLEDPILHLFTDKDFKELYTDLIFSDIKLKDIEFMNGNELHAYGYAKILGNIYFSGERRFDLYAKKGKYVLGWRIITFVIK